MSSSGTNTEFNRYQESRQQRVLSNIQELLDTESDGQSTLKPKLWRLVNRIEGIPKNLEEKFLECVSTVDVWNLLIFQKQKQFLEKTIDTDASFDVMKALFNDYCLYSELGRDPRRFPSPPRGPRSPPSRRHPRRRRMEQLPTYIHPRSVRRSGEDSRRQALVYDDFMRDSADDMARAEPWATPPPHSPSFLTNGKKNMWIASHLSYLRFF